MASQPSAAPELRLGPAGWVIAVTGPLAVSGIMVAIRGDIRASNAALVLVLAVLGAALVGGRWGGVVSAVIAAGCFDFFFTRPYYSFTISSRDDVETTIFLLAVGIVVGELVRLTRRSQQQARASKQQVEQIRRFAEIGAGGGPAGRLITVVEREIIEVLGTASARFERPPFKTLLASLGHGKVSFPATDQTGRVPLGPDHELELPIWGKGVPMGRLVLVFTPGTNFISIPPDDRGLAVALADQLGVALNQPASTT